MDADTAVPVEISSEKRLLILGQLPRLLATGRQVAKLFTLARDESFLGAQADGFPEDPDLPLRTIRLALETANEIESPTAAAEFLLAHARRLSRSRTRSPLDTLRQRGVFPSWQSADLFDGERRALWHLLLAAELAESGRCEDAIRTVQRLHSSECPRLSKLHGEQAACWLIPLFEFCDGVAQELSRALLDDDATVRLCEHLASHNRVDAARSASQNIKGYPETRVKALSLIASAQAAQDGVGARATFAAAIDASRQIAILVHQAWALCDIARRQVTALHPEGAKATVAMARTIAESMSRSEGGWRLVCAVLNTAVDIGDLRAAVEMVPIAKAAVEVGQALEFTTDRHEALECLAHAQLRVGETDTALPIAEAIQEGGRRAKVLSDVALAQLAAGDSQGARATWGAARSATDTIEARAYTGGREYDSMSMRVRALEELLAAQVDARAHEEARETLAAAEAVARMAQDPDDRAEASLYLAWAQARVGAFPTARATADAIEEGLPRMRALRQIARIQAEAGDRDGARETWGAAIAAVLAEGDTESTADAIRDVAADQAGLGEREASKETWGIALAVALRVTDTYGKLRALGSAADALIRVGDLEGALKAARPVRATYPKLLFQIAQAQAASGDTWGARTTWAEALIPVEATDDSFWHRLTALSWVATAQAGAGNHDGAQATWAVALERTLAAGEFRDREIYLLTLAKVQVRAGDGRAALVTAGQFRCPILLTDVLRFAALAAARAGQRDEARGIWGHALRAAASINDSYHRPEALRTIAREQAEAGDDEAVRFTWSVAVRLAQAVEDTHERTRLLKDVLAGPRPGVDRETAQKVCEVARATAETAEEDWDRVELLRCAAWALAIAGEVDAALTAARAIPSAHECARALRHIGAVQAMGKDRRGARATWVSAFEAANVAGDPAGNTWLLREIAALLARIGARREALTVTRAIDSPKLRSKTLRGIARAQVRAGREVGSKRTLAEAHDAARLIKPALDRVCELCKVANAMAMAGDHKRARQARADACSTARIMEEVWDRPFALRRVAESQAQGGETDLALATAQEIEEGARARADAFREIASRQMAAGDREGAQGTWASAIAAAKAVERGEDRVEALRGISHALTQFGQRQEAGEVFAASVSAAELIEEARIRGKKLSEAAVRLALSGLGEVALEIGNAIPPDDGEHLSQIASALVDAGHREQFRRLLSRGAYSFEAAFAMTGLLATLYPSEASRIAEILNI